MARKAKKSTPTSEPPEEHAGVVPWKYTKAMNMRDLSRDDDYLSHIFVEKLGSIASAPLLVHKMDPLRRLPKTDAADVLTIVQRLIRARPNGPPAIKQAVNELLTLPPVLYFIKEYEQCQINAFATHASRYVELYLPSGSIEIAQTSRYSKWTGKNELCILATRPMAPGHLISELKGSMADLTEDEDRELKRTGPRNDGGTRRDFSVIHSKQMKKNHLFLGPARFVNHDCDNNCELFRNGRYITFRAIKPIAVGQEITAHYGDGYFGHNNRHCLCETCERLGRGGYAPQSDTEEPVSNSESDSDSSDSDSDTSSTLSDSSDTKNVKLNVNQRSTRRGVYLVLPDSESDSSDDSESETETVDKLIKRAEGTPSQSITRSTSSASIATDSVQSTPTLSRTLQIEREARTSSNSLPSPTSSVSDKRNFKSLITTRSQSRAASASTTSRSTPLQGNRGFSANVASAVSTPQPEQRKYKTRRSEPLPPPPVARPRGRPRKHALPAPPAEDKKATSSESRVLRGRRSLPSTSAAAKGSSSAEPSQQELPKKPVPTGPCCITCLLPLLASPDASSSPSRKLKAADNEDCSRCKRHRLIYGALWPQRNPSPGSTPRELTPAESGNRSSQAQYARQLLSAYNIKRLRDAEEERAAAPKKRKVGVHDDSASDAASSASTSRASSSNAYLHRRDVLPPASALARVKVETVDGCAVVHGRNFQLRLGQKRAADAELELDEVFPHDPGVFTAGSSARLRTYSKKRGRAVPPVEDPPAPSAPVDVDPVTGLVDDRRDKEFWPALPSLPPLGSGMKRLCSLTMRPNPVSVSRWRQSPLRNGYSTESTPTLVDDDTDNDAASDEHPATPENEADDVVEVVRSEVIERQGKTGTVVEDAIDVDSEPQDDDDDEVIDTEPPLKKPIVGVALKGVGLGLKPSPVVLAKRTWGPSSSVPITADMNEDDFMGFSIGGPATPLRQRAHRKNTIQSLLRAVHKTPIASRKRRDLLEDTEGSSGEEDVIMPGPPDSTLYLLQSNVTFRSSMDDTTPLSTRDTNTDTTVTTTTDESNDTTPKQLRISDSKGTQKDMDLQIPHATVSSVSVSLRIPPLGQLHSNFLSSARMDLDATSPSLVNAGWDSDCST